MRKNKKRIRKNSKLNVSTTCKSIVGRSRVEQEMKAILITRVALRVEINRYCHLSINTNQLLLANPVESFDNYGGDGEEQGRNH